MPDDGSSAGTRSPHGRRSAASPRTRQDERWCRGEPAGKGTGRCQDRRVRWARWLIGRPRPDAQVTRPGRVERMRATGRVGARTGPCGPSRTSGDLPEWAPSAASSARYHPRDGRPWVTDRRRRPSLPLRRLRGRSGRAGHRPRPPSPLLCRAAAGTACARPPGRLLPLLELPGVPHVPGLGASRSGRRAAGVGGAGSTLAMSSRHRRRATHCRRPIVRRGMPRWMRCPRGATRRATGPPRRRGSHRRGPTAFRRWAGPQHGGRPGRRVRCRRGGRPRGAGARPRHAGLRAAPPICWRPAGRRSRTGWPRTTSTVDDVDDADDAYDAYGGAGRPSRVADRPPPASSIPLAWDAPPPGRPGAGAAAPALRGVG